jgi:hypothetical protein
MLFFYTQYNIKSIKVQQPKLRKIKLIDDSRHTVSKKLRVRQSYVIKNNEQGINGTVSN